MKLMRLLVFSTMLIAMLACTPQVSQSTLVIPASLESMADKADTIVNGTVRSSYGYREGDWIFTGVTVDVLDYIKSDDASRPSEIELKVPGGEAEGQRIIIDHAPRFKPGQEVLLFLDRRKDKYLVFGIYYGACYVVTGMDGVSKKVVGPVFSERKVMNAKTRTLKSNPLPPDGETLESFVQRIKKLVGRK
jgi:hypothetical protein